MVAKMAGTVMNGPVPTMFDMLMETALRSPRLRGSRACSAPDRAAGVLEVAVKSEPILWIFQSEYCNSLKITQEFSDFPKRSAHNKFVRCGHCLVFWGTRLLVSCEGLGPLPRGGMI